MKDYASIYITLDINGRQIHPFISRYAKSLVVQGILNKTIAVTLASSLRTKDAF